MFALAANIQIGTVLAPFTYSTKVVVKNDWRKMTNTCVIELPRNLKTRDNLKIDEVLKVGDAVTYQRGYDTDLVPRFTGYVASIGAATAICKIECEDEMWNLKQNSYTMSWPNATVDGIISYLKSKMGATWPYNILGDNVSIGAFKIEKCSAAKTLQLLKDQYGIYSFFRLSATGVNVLYVGKPYEPDNSLWNTVQLEYGRNVINWKGLTYKRATDIKLLVTAVNHLPNGSKTQIQIGDPGGEERTLDFFNLDAATLKNSANELLAKMKYDGYRGKLPLFGQPFVSDGYVAQLTDWRYPERNGTFFIDSVEETLKVASLRQIVELGPVATIQDT
jgi:hypothetical protein